MHALLNSVEILLLFNIRDQFSIDVSHPPAPHATTHGHSRDCHLYRKQTSYCRTLILKAPSPVKNRSIKFCRSTRPKNLRNKCGQAFVTFPKSLQSKIVMQAIRCCETARIPISPSEPSLPSKYILISHKRDTAMHTRMHTILPPSSLLPFGVSRPRIILSEFCLIILMHLWLAEGFHEEIVTRKM